MIETISKKVAPENENELITVMSNFGWSFKSSQEINSAESHLEGIGDTVYSVTTRENYVKLVFQRDTTMPNYARIKELETKYTNIVASEPNAPHFGAIDVFICFIGFMMYIIPGVLYIRHYKKKKRAYEEEYPVWVEKMKNEATAYFNEASALVK